MSLHWWTPTWIWCNKNSNWFSHSALTLFACWSLAWRSAQLAQSSLLSLSPSLSLSSPLGSALSPHVRSLALFLLPFLLYVFAGIFHHAVSTVSSHQFGATQPTSGGLGSLLSLSSSSSTSSQTQQHSTHQPASTRLTSVSSPLPLTLSQTQHSRIQSVLHSPSPPTLTLPPPPPLHSAPSSSAPTHSDTPSRSDSLHPSRLLHSSLLHQRAQSSLSLSITTSSISASPASVSAAATASITPSSSLATLSSPRPFTVHYSPRLPPPPPVSSSGTAGSMWRNQSMHGTSTISQLPGSRPR